RVVNFKNTIIIMTSNMGSHIIRDNFEKITDDNKEEVIENTKQEVLELLKKQIRPEFLNRIDEIIMFTPLSESEIKEIVELQLDSVKRSLKQNDILIQFTPAAVSFIAVEGYDPQFGARPVKRMIQKYILNELSKQILSEKVDKDKTIVIDSVDNKLYFTNE
ncbi:MAG: AAA family ATPase, partial [Tannerellaceae bacterium]